MENLGSLEAIAAKLHPGLPWSDSCLSRGICRPAVSRVIVLFHTSFPALPQGFLPEALIRGGEEQREAQETNRL